MRSRKDARPPGEGRPIGPVTEVASTQLRALRSRDAAESTGVLREEPRDSEAGIDCDAVLGKIGRNGTGAKRQGLSRYDNQAARAETYGKFSGPTTGSASAWSSRCRKPGQISLLSASKHFGGRPAADSERLEGAPRQY